MGVTAIIYNRLARLPASLLCTAPSPTGGRPERALCLLIGGLLLALQAAPASATPLLDSRVGGLELIGPASPAIPSLFYNPATLRLLTGHQLYFSSTLRLGQGTTALAPVDPVSGQPTNGALISTAALDELSPQFFGGISSSIGSESVVLSLSIFNPYVYRFSRLPGDGDWFDSAQLDPTRYFGAEMNLFQLYVSTAAAFKVADILSFGVSISYVFGRMDLAFVRDAALEGGSSRGPGEYVALDDCGDGAACNYGSDAAAEAVRIRAMSNGIGFAAGVLLQPHPDLDLGLGYQGRPLSVGDNDITAHGEAWISRAPAVFLNAQQDPAVTLVRRDLAGRGTISFSLPDIVSLGAAWRLSPALRLDLQLRWVNFSVHEKIELRLTGNEFRKEPQVPGRMVLFRGFQDVIDVQLAASYALAPALTLAGGAMFESSAVPTAAVSPAAIDGPKLDAFLTLRWSPLPGWTMGAGYGLVWVPTIDVSRSEFNPAEMVACVDSRYDVELEECKQAAKGHGLHSAVGRYTLLVHRFALSLALAF